MNPRAASPTQDAGFTLIEVIVALAILAAGLLAFYQFLGVAMQAAGRVQHAVEAYDRDQNALALAASLNPMATPEGTFNFGPYRVHWRAEPITGLRRSTAYPGNGEGQFIVALYRVVLDFPGDYEFAPVEVTKLGYHRAAVPGQPTAEPAN